MTVKNKGINILTYSFLFVCLFTSHNWREQLCAGGEVFRFDNILLFGKFNVYHLFAGLFFLIVYFEKFGPNNDRNILGDRNYLKTIFLMYFIPVNILIYITIYIKSITLTGAGTTTIGIFFVYLVATFYIQDVFLKNKDYKQLLDVLTVLEVLIVIRCCYSIIKYLLGFGYHDALLGRRVRLGYESDFADFFILLFIIASVRLLFDKNESKKIERLHKIGVLISSIIAIFSFRRYWWGELLTASFIILFSHYRFNKVHLNKKGITTCFFVVVIIGSILFVGPDKITRNQYVGRLLTSLSLINAQKFSSQYGTETGHIDELKDGWYNVRKNLLLGITPFGNKLMKRFKTAAWQDGLYVHNAYLLVWLVYGLLGLVLFLALYWKSVRLGLKLYKKGHPYGLILFAFCCAQLLKNVVWGTVITFTNVTIVYIFIISIAIRMRQIIKDKNEGFNNYRLP